MSYSVASQHIVKSKKEDNDYPFAINAVTVA